MWPDQSLKATPKALGREAFVCLVFATEKVPQVALDTTRDPLNRFHFETLIDYSTTTYEKGMI